MDKKTSLDEYREGIEQADQHWDEYLKTESPQAFANYLAVNRSLSAIYADLVREGMTLEDIRSACAQK